MAAQAMTVAEALALARATLAPHSETAALDAQTLLAHLTGRGRAWVLAHPEAVLPPEVAQAVREAVARLARGEPLPYVLGRWPFFGREFFVTPAVLIPRPETENLVERALAWLRAHPDRRQALDVGTGSGCIAVTLAAEVPDLRLVATDCSAPALAVARRNAQRHGVAGRILWVQADGLAPLPGPWDLICANPPYIPSPVVPTLKVARYEPRLALDGGPDGLQVLRRWLQQAHHALAPGGCLLCEIGADQGPAALDLARRAFPDARIAIWPDDAGRDRILEVLREFS